MDYLERFFVDYILSKLWINLPVRLQFISALDVDKTPTDFVVYLDKDTSDL